MDVNIAGLWSSSRTNGFRRALQQTQEHTLAQHRALLSLIIHKPYMSHVCEFFVRICHIFKSDIYVWSFWGLVYETHMSHQLLTFFNVKHTIM